MKFRGIVSYGSDEIFNFNSETIIAFERKENYYLAWNMQVISKVKLQKEKNI
jgi:hypothetical protein